MYMIGPLWRYFWGQCRSDRVNGLNNRRKVTFVMMLVAGRAGGREDEGGETKGRCMYECRGRGYFRYRITPFSLASMLA